MSARDPSASIDSSSLNVEKSAIIHMNLRVMASSLLEHAISL